MRYQGKDGFARLDGKVAIITGGASGIGEAVAKEFARAGAFVYPVDLDKQNGIRVESQIHLAGGKAEYLMGDVTDLPYLTDLFQDIYGRRRTLDIVIVNAGKSSNGRAHEIPAEERDGVIAVNVIGADNTVRAAAPLMIKSGGGVFGFTASGASEIGVPKRAVYAPTKAYILELCHCVAIDYAGDGIRAFAVMPGRAETNFATSEEPNRPGYLVRDFPDVTARVKGYEDYAMTNLIGAWVQPDDVAKAFRFLASKDARTVTMAGLELGGFSKGKFPPVRKHCFVPEESKTVRKWKKQAAEKQRRSKDGPEQRA
ncbi:SDR family oxidoreductase [Candidatus Woesearchaeota archaeon]|nr:SDR family oxidoreductase [Candidatus Woesearchaeota archaeon]